MYIKNGLSIELLKGGINVSKVMTSIRVDDSVRDRLQAYNNIREAFGFRRYSMAECVEQCIDIWIKQDKVKMAEFASALQDELENI